MAIWKKKALAGQNYLSEYPVERKPKKKKKTRVIIAVVIVAIIIIRIVSCAFSKGGGAIVTTAKAERGDLQESISTSGTVSGEKEKVIFSPANGRLAEVAVAAGDAVSEGTMLISFDMDEMERSLRQAALQHDKSDAAYQGALADNAEGSGKLAEANANLKVLEQQINDYKARIKELQRTLDENVRNTGNGLAESDYSIRKELAELQGKRQQLISNSGSVTSGDGSSENIDSLNPQQQQELAELDKKIADLNKDLSRNTYLQSIYTSSDYVTELKQEIEDVQEKLTKCEEQKAKMESQKATGESKTLDAHDKKQFSADKELAEISYEQAVAEYEAAKIGIRADFDGIVTECGAVAGAAVTEGMQLLKLESSGEVKVSFNASKYDIEKLKTGQKADVTISGRVYEGKISKINRMASAMGNSTTPMVGVEIHLLNPDDAIILGLDAKLTVYTNKAENALLIPVEAVNADKNGDFLYIVENGKVVKRDIVCGISTDTYTEVLEGITEEDEIIISAFVSLEEGMAVTVMPQS